jgi:hypothetical protein
MQFGELGELWTQNAVNPLHSLRGVITAKKLQSSLTSLTEAEPKPMGPSLEVLSWCPSPPCIFLVISIWEMPLYFP